MHLRLILAAALAVGLSSAVQAQTAQVVPMCGASSGVAMQAGPGGKITVTPDGSLCTNGGSGGGSSSTGSVTAPGTNGTQAQAIQGINGGVPVPVTGSFAAAPIAGSQEQDVRGNGTLDATKTAGAGSFIDIPVNGQSSIGLRFSGLQASGATISYLQSVDGGTTYTAMAENNTGTGGLNLTRSTDGQVGVNAARRTNVRLQVTTAGTGTISAAWNVSIRPFAMAIDAPLPPGANTIGSIANTGFAINGTLPAYAATPTFNVGTTNGLALDATLTARLGTLGQKASAGSAPVVIASDQAAIPVSVGNFPASQAVTNTGTFPVQNTAPVVGGNATAVKTDGSATTQPVSGAVTANLGTLNGAATAANQNATAAGTSATSAQAVQGVTGGVPQNVVGTVVSAPVDAPTPTTFSFTATGSTAWVDTTGYAFLDVDLSSFGSGNSVVVQYQGSGGTANTATTLFPGNLSSGGLLAFQSVPTTGLTRVPVQGKLMRLTVAVYGSGTIAGALTLRANGWAPSAVYLTNNNINATPTASTTLAGPTPVTTTTSAAVGKASPANLYGYSITQGATAGFLALLNATSAPAASAAIAPLECVPVPANGYVARRQDIPDRYTTGLVIVSTSSCTTYTAVTPTLMSVIAQ